MTDILQHVPIADAIELARTDGPLTDLQLHQLAQSTAAKIGLSSVASDNVMTQIAVGAQMLAGRCAKPEVTAKLAVLFRRYARAPRHAGD